MAQRRMFSKEVTNSDEFLDMSLSAQALYFHLGMNADDDGFVQPKSIMRLVQAKDDDVRLLASKGFIIPFKNSVIVITHWKVNNELKNDRHKATIYQEHLKTLGISDSNTYMYPKCIQNVSSLDTQVRIGKDSIGKVRKAKVRREREEIKEEIRKAAIATPTQFFESEEDQLNTLRDIVTSTGRDEEWVFSEMVKFKLYWTEKNQKGRERWQLEKTFEVPRRLKTWLDRAESFKK